VADGDVRINIQTEGADKAAADLDKVGRALDGPGGVTPGAVKATSATKGLHENFTKLGEGAKGLTGIMRVLGEAFGLDEGAIKALSLAHGGLREAMRSVNDISRATKTEMEATTVATEAQTAANKVLKESTSALAGGITIAVVALGAAVLAIAEYTVHTKQAQKAEEDRSKAIDGTIILDKKLRESYDDNIIKVKELENEYKVMDGTLSDTAAAVDNLSIVNKAALLHIQNDTKEKLDKASGFWTELGLDIVNSFKGMNEQQREAALTAEQTKIKTDSLIESIEKMDETITAINEKRAAADKTNEERNKSTLNDIEEEKIKLKYTGDEKIEKLNALAAKREIDDIKEGGKKNIDQLIANINEKYRLKTKLEEQKEKEKKKKDDVIAAEDGKDYEDYYWQARIDGMEAGHDKEELIIQKNFQDDRTKLDKTFNENEKINQKNYDKGLIDYTTFWKNKLNNAADYQAQIDNLMVIANDKETELQKNRDKVLKQSTDSLAQTDVKQSKLQVRKDKDQADDPNNTYSQKILALKKENADEDISIDKQLGVDKTDVQEATDAKLLTLAKDDWSGRALVTADGNAQIKELQDAADQDKKDAAKKIAAEIKKIEKDQIKETIDGIKEVADAAIQGAEEQNAAQQKATDFRLQQQSQAIDVQAALAEKGLANDLAFEQRKNAQLQQQKLAEIKKEKQEKELETFLNAVASFAEKDPNTAVPKALGLLAATTAVAAAYAEEGGLLGYSGQTSKVGLFGASRKHRGGGDILLHAQKGEGILSRKDIDALGGPKGFYDLKEMLKSPSKSMSNNIVAVNNNTDVVNKLEEVKQAFSNLKQEHVDWQANQEMIITTVQSGMKEVVRHISKKPRI